MSIGPPTVLSTAFPPTSPCEGSDRRTMLRGALSPRAKSPVHRVEERRAAERLLEEGKSASLETLTAGLVVAVSRQYDGRHERPGRCQMPQQVQASHPRHSQIEHEAAGSLPGRGLQERFRGDERLDVEAHRSQKIAERSPEGCIVINDDHAAIVLAGECPQKSSRRRLQHGQGRLPRGTSLL